MALRSLRVKGQSGREFRAFRMQNGRMAYFIDNKLVTKDRFVSELTNEGPQVFADIEKTEVEDHTIQ